MTINFVHIRPSDAPDKRYAALSGVNETPAFGIVLGDVFTIDVLKELSRIVVQKGARLVSVYGRQSEALHDLVDREAQRSRQPGEVITTFDQIETIAEFVRTVYFVYRGVLDTTDQDRDTIICYVSDKAVPKELEDAIARIRSTILPTRNGSSGGS